MMVSIQEALDIIYKNVKPKSTKLLPIEDVLDYVIAQDITATHNLPPYNNSAMDGYAVKIDDSMKCVKVIDTIFAGDNVDKILEDGFAIKVMTGAMLPKNTQCIVPIEDTKKCENGVLLPKNLVKNKHIRFCAEDIQKDKLLLKKGSRLGAFEITLLASQGISHIKVYKKPKIAIFSSGNELKMHFESVEKYQLYNTNVVMLISRAKELGCDVEFIGSAKDSLEDIKQHIQSALDSDIIITSGGVSVGDADFTKEAFSEFGYEIFFDKIDIKPGKPTTFGKIKDKFILNLPGNPLAAALNFELFAQSIILAMSGDNKKYIKPINTKTKLDIKIKKGRDTLVPGFFDGEFFTPAKTFAPGMIMPLLNTNSYIIISKLSEGVEANSAVKVLCSDFRDISYVKDISTT